MEPNNQNPIFPTTLLTKLEKEDDEYQKIKSEFFLVWKPKIADQRITVVAVHKSAQSMMTEAKNKAFELHAGAAARKNKQKLEDVQYHNYFGTSRERVESIIAHGFSLADLQGPGDPWYGNLILDYRPAESLDYALVDENGLQHVLICKFILANPEVVRPHAWQTRPSSLNYDSGVDNMVPPKKHIIWFGNINVQVVPEYVISLTIAPPLASFKARSSLRINSPYTRISSVMLIPTRRLPSFHSRELMIELEKGCRTFLTVKARFLANLGSTLAEQTTVVAVYHPLAKDTKVKLDAFDIHSNAVAGKNKEQLPPKYYAAGWFGTSRARVESIILDGFNLCDLQGEGEPFCGNLVLASSTNPAECLEKALVDETGLRHVLICRFIRGKPEVVRPDSGQTHPSSAEFDSGVDDLTNTKKHIIWFANVNVHVLPWFVVSFKTTPLASVTVTTGKRKRSPEPITPSVMPNPGVIRTSNPQVIVFDEFYRVLLKYLELKNETESIRALCSLEKDFKENKITSTGCLLRLRLIAGVMVFHKIRFWNADSKGQNAERS